jgi:hypothetical protein
MLPFRYNLWNRLCFSDVPENVYGMLRVYRRKLSLKNTTLHTVLPNGMTVGEYSVILIYYMLLHE